MNTHHNQTRAECVDVKDRFKFVDDLTILEIVNLLTMGIASMNMRQTVPSHLQNHNQFIPAQNLQSQKWLDQINKWTENQKMIINEKKTKTMLINFTEKYQFATRLQLKDENVEVINSTKLLGTVISSGLKCNLNTQNLV